MNEWISVEDKLPTEQDLYLCCGSLIDWQMHGEPDTIFTAGFYLPDSVFDFPRWVERTRSCEDVEITHWMELPKLPGSKDE